MKKRITCFLLAVVMTLLCLPTVILPTAAATADAAAQGEKIVYIRFRLGDAREYGYTGSIVKEVAMAPGVATIEYPSEEDLLVYGIKPSDLLGWYVMQPDGSVIDASAYHGVYISDDITFYPYLKSSSMSFNNTSNTPIIATHNTTNTVLALRNGWNAGAYRDGIFATFNYAPDPGLVYESGTNPWGDGGAYYRSGGGGAAMVLSKNAARVLALSYTALASGKVNISLPDVTFMAVEDKPVAATVYLAIAKNDVIVWPAEAAGQTPVTTGFSDAGWFTATAGNAAALTTKTKVSVNAALQDIEVTAGDTIRFYFGYGNARTIDAAPTVSYTTVGQLSDNIQYSLPAYVPNGPLTEGEAPVENEAKDGVTYPGQWEIIQYTERKDIATSDKAAALDHYTTVDGGAKAVLSAGKDYGSAGDCPSLANLNLKTDNWGDRYSLAVKNNGAAVGFRYTAEHAGYLSPAFDQLKKSTVGWAQGAATYNGVRVAIFVDGKMVWPNAGGDATDLTKWYQPYAVDASYQLAGGSKPDAALADKTDAVNEALKNVSFYVRQGTQVDFLLTYAENVSIWGGAGNTMVPAIRYTDLFETNFSASVALADTLAIDFTADVDTVSFSPSAEKSYLLADTLSLTLSCPAEKVVVGTPTVTDGKLRATVSHIVAKQMTEEVAYTLCATAKHPDGKTEQLTLGQGSISIASYMQQLYQKASDDTTRDLILATLQYGAEAQAYFQYKTDQPANAGMNAEPSFTLSAAQDKASQSGSGDYYFSAATLLLEDCVQIKLLVDATAEAHSDWASFYLAVNRERVGATLALRAGSTDGRYLKAIFSVPISCYHTDYTITLHKADGTQISSTLVYSVESYAARTADVADQTALVEAVRMLGAAAQEYKAMTTPTEDGNIVTRLVFLSDAHVGETLTNAAGKLAAQLAQIKTWDEGGQSVDAVIFPGDMVNLGINSEYETFNQIIRDAGLAEDIQLSFSIGNHEFSAGTDGTKGAYTDTPSAAAIQWTFTAFNNYIVNHYHTADNYTLSEDGIDHVLRLSNGVHVIGLSMRGGGTTYGKETEKFLKQAIENAVAEDPEKPILIYNHIGYGEIKGSSAMSISEKMKEFVNDYPQIIWFTGHTHYALQDPNMIQQKNFTNIQLPTAGSKWWWYYYAGYTSPASYAYEANQGLILTISDTNVVYAERYDFGTQETIGQKWRIDIPAILRSKDNFTYTVAKRTMQAAAPTFAADAALTVSDIMATAATVTTPLATIEDDVSDDVVEYYSIIVTDETGTIVYSEKLLSEYYRGSRQNPTMTFSLSGLRPGTTYKVYVRADSIFQKTSASLQTTFTTQESQNPQEYLTEIVDIDYRDGIADDRQGHTLSTVTDGTAGAGPVLKDGKVTFDGKSAYRYTLNASDKTAMADTLTIEAVLSVDKVSDHATLNWGYGSLVSNMEGGGFALKYKYQGGASQLVMEVRNSATGDYLAAAADITLQEEMHIVATVGNGYISLYVNGKRVAQTAFSGSIMHNTSSVNPHALLVGGDPDYNGALQCPSYCTVKQVRLYAEHVTPDDAALLYANACEDVTLRSLTQILGIDYATGSAADRMGHTFTTIGTPAIQNGEAVFAGNGAYRYALTAEDDKKIASSVTIETVVTITENNKADWHGIVSSMNAGGFGLLFYDENYAGAGEGNTGKLKFEYNTKGIGYKSVFSQTVTVGEKMHVVVSYDGYVATMYINGQLLGTCTTNADLNLHSDPCMVVGADHNGGTNIERRAYCKIGYVNMYAEGVNYDQVQLMYQNALKRNS